GVAPLIDFGLKQEDLERLRTMPELAAIVPLRDTEQRVVRGDLRVQANAIGTTPRIFEIINLRLSRGQFFDQVQYDRGDSVCVMGYLAAQQLFPYEDPIGQTIRVGTPGRGTVVVPIICVLAATVRRPGVEGGGM